MALNFGGGHPDRGISGVSAQHEAGTGMESAYGGAAIGVPGGAPAGQNEMNAFLDTMRQRYGLQSLKNYLLNWPAINKYSHERNFPSAPGGRRAFGGMYDYGMPSAQATAVDMSGPVMGTEDENRQTSVLDYGVPPGAMSNPPHPEMENSPQSRMTRIPFGDLGLSYPAAGNMFDALDAQEANKNFGMGLPATGYAPRQKNFTAFDQGWLDQMHEEADRKNALTVEINEDATPYSGHGGGEDNKIHWSSLWLDNNRNRGIIGRPIR